jgi:phosphate:Na+ symporter
MQEAAAFDFWKFLAGLGLFIFSMNMVERSLRGFSGRSVQKFIQKQAQYPFRILIASIIITALLQSSSLLLMLVLTYCSAGILPVSAALLATLGANVGTTLDTWLIVFLGFEVHLEKVIYPMIGFSSILLAVSQEKSKVSALASFLMGLSVLLLSLEWLKYSLNVNSSVIPIWLKNGHYLLFIPAGIILTAIIQSSLATAAIALSAIYHGVISFDQAAALVIGAETGTTLKFLLASTGSTIAKKKVAYANFYINLATTFLATLLLPTVIWLIREKMGLKNELYALAALQTSFNLLSMALFIPFLSKAETILNNQFGQNSPASVQFLNSTGSDISNLLHPAYLEVLHLFNHVLSWNKFVLQISQSNEDKNWRTFFRTQNTDHFYREIKMLEGEILEFLSKTENREAINQMPEKRRHLINSCRYLGRSAKCLKDIQHNLSEFEIGINETISTSILKIKKHSKELIQLLEMSTKDAQVIKLNENLLTENKKLYESYNDELVTLLSKGSISELDMANLLNINREMYESNKAMLKAALEISRYLQFSD